MNKFTSLLITLVIMSLSTIFLSENIDRMSLTFKKKDINLCLREYAKLKRENSVQTCNDILCTIDFTSKIVYDKQNECLSLSDNYEKGVERYIYKYNKDFIPYGIYP